MTCRTISSSVAAGEVIHENPMMFMAPLSMSASCAAKDDVAGKYAKKLGLCQCVMPAHATRMPAGMRLRTRNEAYLGYEAMEGSMYNTPLCCSIYRCSPVFKHSLSLGGLKGIHQVLYYQQPYCLSPSVMRAQCHVCFSDCPVWARLALGLPVGHTWHDLFMYIPHNDTHVFASLWGMRWQQLRQVAGSHLRPNGEALHGLVVVADVVYHLLAVAPELKIDSHCQPTSLAQASVRARGYCREVSATDLRNAHGMLEVGVRLGREGRAAAHRTVQSIQQPAPQGHPDTPPCEACPS